MTLVLNCFTKELKEINMISCHESGKTRFHITCVDTPDTYFFFSQTTNLDPIFQFEFDNKVWLGVLIREKRQAPYIGENPKIEYWFKHIYLLINKTMTEENLALKEQINKMHLFCSNEDDELVPDRVEDNFDVIKEILLSLLERIEQLEKTED